MQVPPEAKQKYIERRKQDIVACKDALTKKDFLFFERIGHQIKGNASTFGFDQLTSIAIEIENGGKAKDLTVLKELVLRLEEAVNLLQ